MLQILHYVLLALGGWCAFALLFVFFRAAFRAAFFGIYPWGSPHDSGEGTQPKHSNEEDKFHLN